MNINYIYTFLLINSLSCAVKTVEYYKNNNTYIISPYKKLFLNVYYINAKLKDVKFSMDALKCVFQHNKYYNFKIDFKYNYIKIDHKTFYECFKNNDLSNLYSCNYAAKPDTINLYFGLSKNISFQYKNIVFLQGNSFISTSVHELLHAFSLHHTYSIPNRQRPNCNSENIMFYLGCYPKNRLTNEQWKKVNEYLKINDSTSEQEYYSFAANNTIFVPEDVDAIDIDTSKLKITSTNAFIDINNNINSYTQEYILKFKNDSTKKIIDIENIKSLISSVDSINHEYFKSFYGKSRNNKYYNEFIQFVEQSDIKNKEKQIYLELSKFTRDDKDNIINTLKKNNIY